MTSTAVMASTPQRVRRTELVDLRLRLGGNDPGDPGVIEDFQFELHGCGHEPRAPGGRLAILALAPLHRAGRCPSPDLVAVQDKADAVPVRVPGECNPAALVDEDPAAGRGVAGPCPGHFHPRSPRPAVKPA